MRCTAGDTAQNKAALHTVHPRKIKVSNSTPGGSTLPGLDDVCCTHGKKWRCQNPKQAMSQHFSLPRITNVFWQILDIDGGCLSWAAIQPPVGDIPPPRHGHSACEVPAGMGGDAAGVPGGGGLIVFGGEGRTREGEEVRATDSHEMFLYDPQVGYAWRRVYDCLSFCVPVKAWWYTRSAARCSRATPVELCF